ncbi:MAG TPA: CDP-alcohol phosphatidyltransferase family protein [Kofleriaceae bacterium]
MLLLAPAIVLLAVFVIGLAVFAVVWKLGRVTAQSGVKHNDLFGPFFGRFLVWMMTPLEWLLVGRVSANAITAMSLLLAGIAGVAAGLGHFVAACWTFALSGILDALDGRIARLSGQQTQAGALFDSVSDRWGELALGTGFAWYLRDTPWLLAALASLGGSMMVSYTRARAEGLGIELRGGMMQRAERIVLISLGTFLAAWWAVHDLQTHVIVTLGAMLTLSGITAIGTAVSRWVQAYRELVRRNAQTLALQRAKALEESDQFLKVPVPAKLRESNQLSV